mmetsp:Transcript_10215/g.16699  ORF Transcript_10215/g.16699 Transcript_10215/m.16699 type:complete len:202 (+) Transcript_10215:1039-1644(+)
MFTKVGDPITFCAIKRLAVRHIKHNNTSGRPMIIQGVYAPKPLLPCGIPDVELDNSVLESNVHLAKGHTDGRLLVPRKPVVLTPYDERRLADSDIPEHHKLALEMHDLPRLRWPVHELEAACFILRASPIPIARNSLRTHLLRVPATRPAIDTLGTAVTHNLLRNDWVSPYNAKIIAKCCLYICTLPYRCPDWLMSTCCFG